MSDEENEEIKTEFQYVPKVPFKYSLKGEMVNVKFITLTAPTSKTTRECAALKQAFYRAMGEREKEISGESDDSIDADIDGSDVMSLLAMSKDVDLPDVMDIGKKLFQMPGIALVDGETKLGNEVFGRISVDDFEDMLGEYMINFILASSLRKLKEKSSKASQT